MLATMWLLVVLTVPEVQARTKRRDQDGGSRRGKRKKDGTGGRAKGGRSRPLKIRPAPGPSSPLDHREDSRQTLFLESYKNVQEQHSSYNVIPGKEGQCVFQGLTMFHGAVWSPEPCLTCLCTGGRVVCDQLTCPRMHCHFPFTPVGECCPVCMEPDPDLSLELSGDSPVHSEPDQSVALLSPEEIQRILWKEEKEQQEEEERLRRKDEARKQRRKQRKEQAERQRKLVEEKRRQEEEALRLELEREEDYRRQEEELEKKRRQEEEDRKQKEAAEREGRERERRLEEDRRRQEERLREELLAFGEEEEEEEEQWLRGDVFQMSPKEPEEPDLLPAPIPTPPVATKEELREMEAEVEQEEESAKGSGLPPGCDISDVTVTCENAKLSYFPPLFIPELKSLSLEGNNISSVPAEAFNGLPNLEWINLSKNQLTTAGIDAKAFRGLKMLRRLYLDGNLLDLVPAGLPPTLQELKISENRLRGVQEHSFQGLSSLVILELEGNLLSEATMDPLALGPLSQLCYLRLGRNHFRTVPQGLPPSLLELYLENNLIEEISESVFNQTQNLNIISLRHNRLDESRIAPLAWIHHRNLESIDLSNNRLHLVPSYLPRSLVHLVLVGNHIERIPGFVFAHMDPGLEYLYLSYNKLDGEGIEPESFFGSFHSMVELCLDHNQLMAVPSGVNEMTNLHFLRLNDNHIRSIPDNSICDPDRGGEATLVALRLENNRIDPQKVSATAFSCVRSSSSVILKPQRHQ